MKEGQYIQHRTRDEWGIGCVMFRSGDHVDVQFGHGLVKLDLKVATPLFQLVTPDAEQVAHLGVTPKAPARARSAKSKAKPKAKAKA